MNTDDEAPLKRQLPYPYDQDLSKVLRHLNRRTEFSRAKLANEPVTAAFLAAAMRLVDRHIGPNAGRSSTGQGGEQSVECPLLEFLSGHEVAREATKNPYPFPRGSYGMFRTTWETQADFIADLVGFGLWPSHYPVTQHRDDTLAVGSEELVEGEDVVQAIHALAYWDSSMIYNLPSFRLVLVAALAAEGNQVILDALAESYRGGLEPWKQLYTEFFQARGLQLRPGLSVEDFASLLSAMAGGVLMRAMGDPASNVIDHDKQRSLLGTGGLALVYACLERAEDASGLTLEQAVHALVCDQPDSEPRTES